MNRHSAVTIAAALVFSSCSAPCETSGGITSTTCIIGPNARAGSAFTISFSSLNSATCVLTADGGAFFAAFPVTSTCPQGAGARPAPQPARCDFPPLDAGVYPFDVGGVPTTVVVPDDGGSISCG